MSFGDRPALSTGKKIGCFAYGVFGTALVMFCVLLAALGDCAREPEGRCLNSGGWTEFLLFPGSLILVIIGGVVLAWYLMRDER